MPQSKVDKSMLSGLPSADYVSGDISVGTDGTFISTNAHALSNAPSLVELYLKCTTAEAGYAVGDMIKTGPGVGSVVGPTVSWDNTSIYICYEGNTFNIADRTTGAAAALSETTDVLDNFVWVIKAWE